MRKDSQADISPPVQLYVSEGPRDVSAFHGPTPRSPLNGQPLGLMLGLGPRRSGRPARAPGLLRRRSTQTFPLNVENVFFSTFTLRRLMLCRKVII